MINIDSIKNIKLSGKIRFALLFIFVFLGAFVIILPRILMETWSGSGYQVIDLISIGILDSPLIPILGAIIIFIGLIWFCWPIIYKNYSAKGDKYIVGGDLIINGIKKAEEDKRNYTLKLEEAKGDDVFKYLLLMNTSGLEEYIAQTRLQAHQSFQLSKIIAVVGFGLIVIGIFMGIYSNISGKNILDAAYLASISGILAEFISGIFFYLYNKTLQQINMFHDKMMTSQHVSLSFLANSLVEDKVKNDDSKIELSKILLTTVTKK